MGAVYDFLTYIGYEYPEDLKRYDNPLWLLGVPPFCAETMLYITHVFIELVRQSDWSKREKTLWLSEYIFGDSISSISWKIRRSPQWVEEHYSICLQKLSLLVRQWWDERLADNPEACLPELLHEYIIDMCNNLEDDDEE